MKKRMNLTRMDHEGCKGWWVRIQRGDKQVSKLFSDGVYGNSRKAETAATKFRDEQLKKLPKRVFVGTKGPRPGAAGYYLRTRTRRGVEEKAWVAIWTEDDQQREKSFSVSQHGHASAKRQAKAHRQEMVEKLLTGTSAKKAAKKTAKVAKKKPVKKKAKKKATKKKATRQRAR